MDASRAEDRPCTADPDRDTSLRMRTAIADAAFIADGLALGLPLRWAEPARPSDDGPLRIRGVARSGGPWAGVG